MNERLTEGEKIKQQAFSIRQSGAPERWSSLGGFRISSSAEVESDWRIMLRNTLKTLKKRFWFVERTRTQGKRQNRGSGMPNIFWGWLIRGKQKGFILSWPFAKHQRPPCPEDQGAFRVMQVIRNFVNRRHSASWAGFATL